MPQKPDRKFIEWCQSGLEPPQESLSYEKYYNKLINKSDANTSDFISILNNTLDSNKYPLLVSLGTTTNNQYYEDETIEGDNSSYERYISNFVLTNNCINLTLSNLYIKHLHIHPGYLLSLFIKNCKIGLLEINDQQTTTLFR